MITPEHDPAAGQQRGNVAQAQVEPIPQPDNFTNDDRRKPVPGNRSPLSNNLTMPCDVIAEERFVSCYRVTAVKYQANQSMSKASTSAAEIGNRSGSVTSSAPLVLSISNCPSIPSSRTDLTREPSTPRMPNVAMPGVSISIA